MPKERTTSSKYSEAQKASARETWHKNKHIYNERARQSNQRFSCISICCDTHLVALFVACSKLNSYEKTQLVNSKFNWSFMCFLCSSRPSLHKNVWNGVRISNTHL